MFFVAGITGKVGGATARKLLQDGHSVRGLVRDLGKAVPWADQGVELRQGDLDDSAALADALQGVEGAFLLMPPTMAPLPGFPEAKATLASYLTALRTAAPARVVFLSSYGSEQPSGLGNITATHMMEEAVKDLPFSKAFLRAGSFMENYLYGLQSAAHTGFLDVLLAPPDRKTPMIATVDIGTEAALLLERGWNGLKIVEIGTPRSPDDLARALSQVLGRPVQARSVPRENWTATLEAMGLPQGLTGSMEEMMDGINSNWIHFGAAGAEPVEGTTPAETVFAEAHGRA